MRSTRALILALALLTLSVWTAPAAAQIQCFGPIQNSVLCSTTASTSASGQVATAQTFYTMNAGTGLIGLQPIHLRSVGYLASVASPGTMTIAVNVGSGFSMTVVNAATLTASLSNAPYTLDCSLVPVSSSQFSKEMQCVFSYTASGTTTAGTTDVRFRSRATGTVSAVSSTAITGTVTFTDTSIGTGLVAQHNQIVIGD